VRGDQRNDQDSEMMLLESLQIQLSQIQSLDLQIKHFYQKLEPTFIQVCSSMIELNDERLKKGRQA